MWSYIQMMMGQKVTTIIELPNSGSQIAVCVRFASKFQSSVVYFSLVCKCIFNTIILNSSLFYSISFYCKQYHHACFTLTLSITCSTYCFISPSVSEGSIPLCSANRSAFAFVAFIALFSISFII